MAGGKCDATGKTQYTTRRAARSALDKLAVRRGNGKHERTAYVCHFCKLWHLSSMGEGPVRTTRMSPNRRWRWDGGEEE